MSTRRKKLGIAGCAVMVLFASWWIYWSPPAAVKGHFSLRDLTSIRWQVRGETLESILQIIEQPDGTVQAWTGRQTAPLAGGGNFFTLHRTKGGWKIAERGGWVSMLSNAQWSGRRDRPGFNSRGQASVLPDFSRYGPPILSCENGGMTRPLRIAYSGVVTVQRLSLEKV